MQLNTLSVQPTASSEPYTSVNQVVRDYYAGKPVIIRGYGPLAGLSVDCYEADTLRSLGYTSVEFCLNTETKEVVL